MAILSVPRASLYLVLGFMSSVALVVSGCAGKGAVAQGGSFDFVSPGGKTTLYYDPPNTRKPIADLRGPDLMQPGRELSVADFPGKVVAINIWGQWCAPCREEMPLLEQTYQQTKDRGVQFLGIDVRDEQIQDPQDFYTNYKISYPSIYDPSMRTLLALGNIPTSAVPITIILDRSHRVAAVYIGKVKPAEFLPALDRITKE